MAISGDVSSGNGGGSSVSVKMAKIESSKAKISKNTAMAPAGGVIWRGESSGDMAAK